MSKSSSLDKKERSSIKKAKEKGNENGIKMNFNILLHLNIAFKKFIS